ncbi:MAG: hypothetical protein ACFC03_03035 [Candidatus Malihini olakiniferum]
MIEKVRRLHNDLDYENFAFNIRNKPIDAFKPTKEEKVRAFEKGFGTAEACYIVINSWQSLS